MDALDKCSGLVHWKDLEGWDGEGGLMGGLGWGTHVNPWLIHVNVWQKPLQYYTVISLQLIKINENKNKKTKKHNPKPMGFSKSIAKWKVCSNTNLPPETGEKSNK